MNDEKMSNGEMTLRLRCEARFAKIRFDGQPGQLEGRRGIEGANNCPKQTGSEPQ
jgi:hypothetical protein